MKYADFENMVKDGILKFHHTAIRRGYVSRVKDLGCGFGNGKLIEYKGRFGEGVIHVTPHEKSSQYVNYNYYIKPFESEV